MLSRWQGEGSGSEEGAGHTGAQKPFSNGKLTSAPLKCTLILSARIAPQSEIQPCTGPCRWPGAPGTMHHNLPCFISVHLIPVSTAKNGVSSKSRKRIMPDPVTEPPVTDPVYEALLYCNIPSVAERSMEGRPDCAARTDTPLGTSYSSSIA